MASDELRLGVPENYSRGALLQLQRHKESFARLPTALRPLQRCDFRQAEKQKSKLTPLPVLRHSSGHRKGRLKILSMWADL
jgi:hypothetical protein